MRMMFSALAMFAAFALRATELAAPDAAHAPETRKHQGIPSVAVSKANGRMWCTYYCDPLGGENHLNYCVLATSADDGRSWKEVLVADPDGAGLKRSFDPEVWIAPDGKLRWTWTERTLDPAKTDLKNTWNGYSNIKSDTLHVAELDAENEPAAPYPPVRALMRGVMMCKPTVVKSGEWVFPLCEWGETPSSKFYVTRNGRDFEYRGGVTLPEDWRQFDEEQMVELLDGRWWALIRTKTGLCESFSSDQGRTWSAPVESKLGHPNSRLFLTKLPSGKLLLVKHGKIGEEPEGDKWKVRKNLRAFVSSDDGKTWDGGLLLDARPGIAYPDGDVGKDGTITVVYDHNRTKEKEILMSRFTEADAYYAGNSSHRIELRQPVSRPTPVRKAKPLTLKLEEGEGWWGGATAFGAMMPFTAATADFARDLGKESWCNQTAPFLVSSKGRWVWCDEPFAFTFDDGTLTVVPSGSAPVKTGRDGGTLRSAFLGAAKRFFPASGKVPDLVTVAAPQYNTWIELNYNQNQADVMAYAKAIVENGLPPGLMAIDDTWQTDYGVWEFDAAKFSDPKGMCDELHKMGFKVELWLAPFVSADSRPYRYLRDTLKEGLIWEKRPNTAAMVEWWNGMSAELDLTDPAGTKWLTDELRGLQTKYGVDGFKFDAADLGFYKPEMCSYKEGAVPADHCEAYARLGLEFPLNEYRACWKMAGQPLVQRLYDKKADWADVRQLIPDMIACGLLGHPFVCPDMIGGGLLWSFREGTVIDQEMFVRSAQVHALCPMMQFSAAPWRVLDKEHFACVKAAVGLRQRFVPRFLELAKASAKSGEPMLRSMEYQFPGNGYAAVKDQFVMGDFLVVAPQMEKGATSRKVLIPPGTWTADDGTEVTGPTELTIETPLERLPYFIRKAADANPHEVSAWRGETFAFEFRHGTDREVRDFRPALEGLPAGFEGRIGLARPVKFEREPTSGEFISASDRVEWNAGEAVLLPESRPRLVVVEIRVPETAKAGRYAFTAAGERVELTVVDRVLPPPKDWKYFLDLWQHPWAVSRWENVKPFSKEHYAAMRPVWTALAACGQKVLTTTVGKLPWNHQCHDGYDTMVRHIRRADGTWAFDYSVFDEYVAFGRACGLGPYIACYTPAPWGYVVYGETESGEELKIQAKPGSKEFEEYWAPFLEDFTRHLKEKGWFDDVLFSMDERAPAEMAEIARFVGKHAPGLKLAAAGSLDPSKRPEIPLFHYSQALGFEKGDFLANNVDSRHREGRITTFYVSGCHYRPNTLLESDSSEAFWCGFYPVAKGMDGLLRWAWNSWPYDPRHDGSFGHWRAGDTYLIYPDASPSVRLLELRNGIIAAEKFRILKEEGMRTSELAALAAKYDFPKARKMRSDLRSLRAETLATVNR